ncbi:glycolate oxidase FAD binding subunit [Albidovulum inexpectatum]|uniref:Glycolate oxidase FAD binding subunit n=1 Tax=Albidovulum inexpectatum TaxID=196587 RepID=A0A2S5JLR3_9RHOB|nr:FAD-binding protein [Albidovulum inexpectatum]PPB82338.1 glycolate oxidase FAD binding subunit [Albidovulum inexpectatum]
MRVTSENELAEAIRDARGPLRIRGGGTRPVGRPVAGELLDVSGLDGVVMYEPEALTIVVRAGLALSALEGMLAAENQRLAFEPADWRLLMDSQGEPTVGGMVAANVSGPRRVQAGACRDAILGVRFVDGTGQIVKNGGRVMKNVTGYDLARLVAGSWGTLGVITEIAFKTLPAPDLAATIIVDVHGATAAVAAMSAALSSPYDVTGAAYVPGEGVMIRVEGFEKSVAYRAGRLEALLGRHGEVRTEIDPVEVAGLWDRVARVAPLADLGGEIWRISTRPSAAPDLVARLAGDYMLDWGGGLIWAVLPEGEDARERLGRFDGHATLIRASEQTRSRIPPFQPQPEPIARIERALRAKFDPRGILNPGVMD